MLFIDGGHTDAAADADYAGWVAVGGRGRRAGHPRRVPRPGRRRPGRRTVIYQRALASGAFTEVRRARVAAGPGAHRRRPRLAPGVAPAERRASRDGRARRAQGRQRRPAARAGGRPAGGRSRNRPEPPVVPDSASAARIIAAAVQRSARPGSAPGSRTASRSSTPPSGSRRCWTSAEQRQGPVGVPGRVQRHDQLAGFRAGHPRLVATRSARPGRAPRTWPSPPPSRWSAAAGPRTGPASTG